MMTLWSVLGAIVAATIPLTFCLGMAYLGATMLGITGAERRYITYLSPLIVLIYYFIATRIIYRIKGERTL